MYNVIEPIKLDYTPLPVDWQTGNNLQLVPVNVMYTGADCIGSSRDQFVDEGLQVRNRLKRLIFAVKNVHTYLNGYVRVPTQVEIMTLAVADIVLEVPADGNIYMFGGFSNIFHAEDTVDVEVVPGTVVQRTYNDFVRINFSHDASDPVDQMLFGAFYV